MIQENFNIHKTFRKRTRRLLNVLFPLSLCPVSRGIGLVITNNPMSIQNTVTITTGVSGFLKIVMTVLKMRFAKLNLKRMMGCAT